MSRTSDNKPEEDHPLHQRLKAIFIIAIINDRRIRKDLRKDNLRVTYAQQTIDNFSEVDQTDPAYRYIQVYVKAYWIINFFIIGNEPEDSEKQSCFTLANKNFRRNQDKTALKQLFNGLKIADLQTSSTSTDTKKTKPIPSKAKSTPLTDYLDLLRDVNTLCTTLLGNDDKLLRALSEARTSNHDLSSFRPKNVRISPEDALNKLGAAVLKARTDIAGQTSYPYRARILHHLDHIIKTHIPVKTLVHYKKHAHRAVPPFNPANYQQVISQQTTNTTNSPLKIALNNQVDVVCKTLNSTAKANGIAEGIDIRSLIDSNVSISDEPDPKRPYLLIGSEFWHCTRDDVPTEMDPQKILNKLDELRSQAAIIDNNQKLMIAIRVLEIRAFKVLNIHPEEVRLFELLEDLDRLIVTTNYRDVSFKALGYKPSFWNDVVKSRFKPHDCREHQVAFIKALANYIRTQQPTGDIDFEAYCKEMTQFIAGGLSLVAREIGTETNNKFTSKLEAILKHVSEKHDLQNDTLEGLALFEKFIELDYQSNKTGFTLYHAAATAGHLEKKIQETAFTTFVS